MYCQKCGAQNDDQATFCDKCGTVLQKARPATTAGVAASPAGVQYAGFWRRFGAYLLDGLIVGVVSIIVFIVLLVTGTISLNDLQGGLDTEEYRHFMLVSYITSAALMLPMILYFAIMEGSSHQATPGKMVLGIKVTDVSGKRISLARAIGRNFLKLVPGIIVVGSYIVLYAVASDPQAVSTILPLVSMLLQLPYIVVAFTEKKQGLHDIVANCLVVVKK